MDNWLKGLIALACLVVCAAGGIYIWSAWRESRDAAEHRAAVFEFLEAKPGDIEAATATCKKARRNLDNAVNLGWNEETIATARKMIAVCEGNGFL